MTLRAFATGLNTPAHLHFINIITMYASGGCMTASLLPECINDFCVLTGTTCIAQFPAYVD